MNGYRKRQLVALLVTILGVAAFFALVGGARANPTVDAKRAAAQRAVDQINQMDMQFEKVVERYNGAMYHYRLTVADLKRTKYALGIARRSLGHARHALARRVISVYMDQGSSSDSTIAILFQATSIQDMIDRMESAQRVSDHDAQVVKEVKILGDQVAARAVSLTKMERKQKALLDEISSEKRSIQGKIAERKAYVHSVRREIASILAEQKRQAALAAQRAQQTVNSYSSAPAVALPNYIAPKGTIPASALGAAVVQAAMSRLGAPYVWAAAGPNEFDCSGLVVWSFAQAGRPGLPHYTGDLMGMGASVSSADLAPGDLIFFYGGSHVGIYIGNGEFIHAPHTGTVVQVTSLSSYSGAYYTARRIS